MVIADMNLIFVDVEAIGHSPIHGLMTEFGAVEYATRLSFHGVLNLSVPDPDNPVRPLLITHVAGKPVEPIPQRPVMEAFVYWLRQFPGRPILVSDNNGYDAMWMTCKFDEVGLANPFGHSSRRISDFYAGVVGDFSRSTQWKKWRVTPHTHQPVDDATGNCEAFAAILELAAAANAQIIGLEDT